MTQEPPVGPRVFPPRDANAKYVFADPFIVNVSDFEDDFDETQRDQLRLATERMTGKTVQSATDIAAAVDEDSPDEFELRLWDVYAANPKQSDRPVFDCWVFNVDNAVFFRHATRERVGVYVLQGSFMHDDGQAASEQLAAELAASQPTSLWES